MKVILIRHPQTEWNRAGIIQGQLDSPLTTRGREESLALIRGLRDAGFHPDAARQGATDGFVNRGTIPL